MQIKAKDGSVILCGGLVRKELKTTKTGKVVCNFTLAVGTDKDEKVFAKCVAWNKLAHCVETYSKGDVIMAVGTITKHSYTSKDGEEKPTTECLVSAIFNGCAYNLIAPDFESQGNIEIQSQQVIDADFVVSDNIEDLPF